MSGQLMRGVGRGLGAGLCAVSGSGAGRWSSSGPKAVPISRASESADRKKLEVEWEDGTRGSVPLAWLRDVATESRLIHVSELSLEVRPEAIAVEGAGSELRIQWPPYDVSRYSTQWLQDHRHLQPQALPLGAREAELWTAAFEVPEISNDLALEADALRQAWQRYGVLKIKAGHNLAEGDFLHLLGLPDLRPLKVSEKSLAKAYPMSTQRAELEQVPRLHTVKAVEAGRGALMVVDGFHVAREFQAEHPELFEFAASRPIAYAAEGEAEDEAEDAHKAPARPIFQLGDDGRLCSVCFSNPRRLRHVLLPQRAQHLLYKSLQTFDRIAMGSYVDVPMSQGDILVVDNARVLTGNSSVAPRHQGPQPLFRLSTFGQSHH